MYTHIYSYFNLICFSYSEASFQVICGTHSGAHAARNLSGNFFLQPFLEILEPFVRGVLCGRERDRSEEDDDY
jgi:hypothetical protein